MRQTAGARWSTCRFRSTVSATAASPQAEIFAEDDEAGALARYEQLRRRS